MKLLLNVFVYLMLVGAQTALANDMYRCGNSYQDTPCKNATSKPINEKTARKNVTTSNNKTTINKAQIPASANTDCKLRGESAKSIANMRDTGLSEDALKANAADSYTAALVTDVYKRTGSAFQIQNAIERECIQQQQKQSLTSKWMSQAKRLLGFGAAPANSNVKNKTSPQPVAINKIAPAKPAQPQIRSTADPKPVLEPGQAVPVPAPAVQPEEPSQPLAPAPTQPVPTQVEPAAPPPVPEPPPPAPVAKPTPMPAEPAPQKPAAQKEVAQEDAQGMCGALKAGLANIASQKRKGGDAAYMKDLKEQQIELENVMKSAGC
jgi:hypothetical protein